MTATLPDMAARKERAEQSAEQQAAVELVRLTKEQGLSLTGPNGPLRQLTNAVNEMIDHLGMRTRPCWRRDRQPPQRHSGPKTVLTEASGPVEIEVPRDRAGRFEPQIVKKWRRRLEGVDPVVLSRYAKGTSRPARSVRTSPRSTARR